MLQSGGMALKPLIYDEDETVEVGTINYLIDPPPTPEARYISLLNRLYPWGEERLHKRYCNSTVDEVIEQSDGGKQTLRQLSLWEVQIAKM